MLQFIRLGAEDDLKPIARLACEIWLEHYPPIIGEVQTRYMIERFQSVEAMRRQIEEGYEYYAVIAEGAAAPCGYIGLQHRPGGELFLSKLYVQSVERGKGQGRRCFEFVLERARALRAAAIVLTVNKHNTGAIQAYERWGLRRTRDVVADIGSGFVMDDWEYRIDL